MPETGHTHQLGLYLRTIRYLRPAQLAWRIRLRAQRRWRSLTIAARLHRPPSPRDPLATTRWPSDFQPIDASRFYSPEFTAEFAAGRITLLGASVHLGGNWRQLDQPQLWRFHLHYWDWAWHLRASLGPAEFSTVIATHYRAWKTANPWGQGDAWAPYVVSLRLWTLCCLHQALLSDESLAREVASDIEEQTMFLRWNCEYDVGGNHLLKNLKALVGGAIFLNDQALLRRAQNELDHQVGIQVLADGGHYERSPAYHAQVLGDLIDMEQLLLQAGLRPTLQLSDAIIRMRRWLHAMAGPQRSTPAFNDGPCVGADELDRLVVHPAAPDRLSWLTESGYVIANPSERVHLVMDVGDPCPDELPAHAHADCLSFTLALDGRPIIVDTGTSEYGAGARRAFERSTAAHNTIEVDGESQTEVWGAFRAASRARPRVLGVEAADGAIRVDAEHDGYRRLEGRPIHRRQLRVYPGGVNVLDTVRGSGNHRSTSHLVMAADGAAVVRLDSRRVRIGSVEVSAMAEISVGPDSYATGFGDRTTCVRLEQWAEGPLPHQLSWDLAWELQKPMTPEYSEEGRGNA